MAARPHLLDTNILLRLTKRDDPAHGLVTAAIDRLLEAGAELCYTPQNLVEFWNVCTRPQDKNGFGLSVAQADHQATLIESRFRVLPESERIHREWRRLIVAHAVRGVQVHDARLVAAMRTHGCEHILTFNDVDFVRYPEIVAVQPMRLLESPRN